MTKTKCYDVSYPAVPGASPSVMHCYRTREAADKRALREANSRRDLRVQDVSVSPVQRDWANDGSSTLLESPYC